LSLLCMRRAEARRPARKPDPRRALTLQSPNHRITESVNPSCCWVWLRLCCFATIDILAGLLRGLCHMRQWIRWPVCFWRR